MFNRRETATVLVALLHWREEMAHQKPAIQRSYFKAVGLPKTRPLSRDVIAKLSRRLRKELA